MHNITGENCLLNASLLIYTPLDSLATEQVCGLGPQVGLGKREGGEGGQNG